MAIIKHNPEHVRADKSWGFILTDSKRNKFPIKYSHKETEMDDEFAIEFINDPRIIVEIDGEVLSNMQKAEAVAGAEAEEINKDPEGPFKLSNHPSYKKIKDLNKGEQCKKLKALGLNKKQIKALHFEDDRIGKIIEMTK